MQLISQTSVLALHWCLLHVTQLVSWNGATV